MSDGVDDFSVAGKTDLSEDGLKIYDIMRELKSVFESDKIEKVLFDAKTIKHRLKEYGIVINGNIFDVMIAKHLTTGESITNFNLLTDDYDRLENLPALSMIEARAVLTEDLEQGQMMSLFRDVEMPLSSLLFEMEEHGFKVDKTRLKELEDRYNAEQVELVKQITELAGFEFNINSPKQMA